jgi:hypothetical protein
VITALGAVGGIIGFWTRYSDRITKADNKADAAQRAADEGRKEAKEALDKIGIQGAAFALYREQVAREYTSRETLREFEDRFERAIDRLGDRIDHAIEQRIHKT